MQRSLRLKHLGYLLILTALLGLSVIVRWPGFEKTTGAPNLEASYHVLLTTTALSESPIREHWLLPTVSLGKEIDKGIPWGATVRANSSHYIYTSFTSPAFVAAHLYFRTFGLDLSLKNLVLFNICLQIVACVLLYFFLIRLLEAGGITRNAAHIAALAGTSLQIFSTEALLSYGLVYWSHQLFQIFFLAALIAAVAILKADAKNCPWAKTFLLCFCFLGAWTEWSGFIFNAGVFAVFGFKSLHASQFRKLTFGVAIATIAVITAIIFHFTLAINPTDLFATFKARLFTRSILSGRPMYLPSGYIVSYGLIIPLVFGAAYWTFASNLKQQPGNFQWPSFFWLVFTMAAVPMIENLILMQHASQFSFDRLKLLIPMSMLLACATAWATAKMRLFYLICLAVACAQNVMTYERLLKDRENWADTHRNNLDLVTNLAKKADLSCAYFATNSKVRGYTNLLLHRGVHENIDQDRFKSLPIGNSHCVKIYLVGKDVFRDLPRFSSALIYLKNGVTEISAVKSSGAAHPTATPK